MSFCRLSHLLVACLIASAFGVPGGALASPEAPAILFLEEDDASRPAYVALMSGFRQALETNIPGKVGIYAENLDLARFPTPDYRNQIRAWFRRKYTGKEIDVVIAFGPTAMELAGELQRDFWPESRILRVSGGFPEQAVRDPLVADLAVPLEAAATLDLARALMPQASRLVVVVGAKSAYSGLNEFILREAGAAAARHGLTLEPMAGLTVAETRRRLSRLPGDVIVFYGSISVDGDGRIFIPRDVLVDLSRASPAPIFGLSDTFMGHGMTGGVVLRMEELGRELAGMTVEALKLPPGRMPASRTSQAFLTVFDWRQLERFGLSRRALPAGAEVRYAPPSLWRNHRPALLGGMAVLLTQSGLIAALLIQWRRRRKAELKVDRQRDQLAHVGRVSSLGELAASIVHELNQPLGAILRNTGAAHRLLQRENPDLPELRAIVADIESDDIRASTVIESLRALFTSQSMQCEPLAIKEVVHQTADLMRGELRRRGVSLKIKITPGLAPVCGDRVHLQQMILNLSLNSMDALEGRKDGVIALEAAPDSSGGRIIVRIQDNGPGIPEGIQVCLFEPFRTTKPAGMGMGLAISQTIAESHGGLLALESTGPEGTSFACTLPTVSRKSGS